MMKQPIFLTPVFKEKIWGGNHLSTEYGYTIPSDKTGECWAISAHPNGVCKIAKGIYEGKLLTDIWDNHKELFGNPKEDRFPLLTKILDANDDLSVQVHPDDTYGLAHEGDLGKTECWYILSAEPGAEIIYGHHAQTKEELRSMIASGQWDKLLRRVPVKQGDFFYVPSGTIHAIGKGIMVLETQQSSDTTYRVYDYDRLGDDGNKRELHIDKSIDVTNVPHQDPALVQKEVFQGKSSRLDLVRSSFFNVYLLTVVDQLNNRQSAPYSLVSVIEGKGQLLIEEEHQWTTYSLEKGQHFILPNGVKNWKLEGNMTLILAETEDGRI